MRQFILKTAIIFVAVYILFQITLGYRINEFSSKIKSMANQQQRIEIKEKILKEMKKAQKKKIFFLMKKELYFLDLLIKSLKS